MKAKENTLAHQDASITNLRESIEYLSQRKPSRTYLHPQVLMEVAEFIHNKFQEYDLSPEFQPFQVEKKEYFNVIGSLGKNKKKRIIIGAHYDVFEEQPGADDNASGVAGLLEVARLIKPYEREIPYRIDFVAYGLEEPPFFKIQQMGSYFHASFLAANQIPVRVMLSFEMIGYFTEEANSQKYPSRLFHVFYPSKGNFVAISGNWRSLGVFWDLKRAIQENDLDAYGFMMPFQIPVIHYSDHMNYWKFGYPALMISDTALYRNPNYHKKTDIPETLDFEKMKKIVKGVWLLLKTAGKTI